jgi:acetyl-CoA acetyltransferase
VTPAQCRSARALAGMTVADLSAAAAVPATTICDLEAGIAPHPRNNADIDAMRRALERAGVEFLNDVGVKLRKAAGHSIPTIEDEADPTSRDQ